MRYLRNFNLHSLYTEPEISTRKKWDVSWCRLEKDVHYAAYRDYSLDYLTFRALEDDCVFILNIDIDASNYLNSISYSLNGGKTWTTLDISSGNYDGGDSSIRLPAVKKGTKVLWKGLGTAWNVNGKGYFKGTKYYSVEGNIMSLLYGDDFKDETELVDRFTFYGLFYKSTKLVSAENLILPATTLSKWCYGYMFDGCTSLVKTPKLLPATELETNCYAYMFNGCTAITKAPKLPAINLVSRCYQYMFNGCSQLNYIEASFVTTPASTYTGSWVSNVAATGTFVKNPEATWTNTGSSSVPSGWTIEFEKIIPDKYLDNPYYYLYLTFKSLEDNNEIRFDYLYSSSNLKTILYSVDDGVTWNSYTANNEAIMVTLNRNLKLLLKGNNTSYGYQWSHDSKFASSKTLDIFGNIMSMEYGDDFVGINIMQDGTFGSGTAVTNYGCFFSSTKVVDASNLILPADSVYNQSYYGMFQGCTTLIHAPELPATKLGLSAYGYMFRGCTSLTNAAVMPTNLEFKALYSMLRMYEDCTNLEVIPDLLTADISQDPYRITFKNCAKLNYIKCLATTLPENGFSGWVNGVSATGTFVKASGVTWSSGTSGIPEGWTVSEETVS